MRSGLAGRIARHLVSAVTAVAIAMTADGLTVSAQGKGERRTVKLRTLSPGDVIYVMLEGGGNSLALLSDEQVVLIDTKSPGWGHAIIEAVQAVGDQPVATVINSHAHIDHTGGNLDLPEGVTIVAHERTRAAMARLPQFQGPGARALPNKTITDTFSLLEGRDRIEISHYGAGHTGGDLVVVFPAKRLAYFGDLFPAKSVPVIDLANGGSAVALPDTLSKAVAAISGVARVITGHPEGLRAVRSAEATSVDISTPQTMSWADLHEYADFTRELLASVRAAQAAGRTAAQATAGLRLPVRYASYDMSGAAAYVEAVYQELGTR